jgi:choline-phosphate cytidylyltransferase
MSIPVTRHSTSNTITSSTSRTIASHSKPSSKPKHQLASSSLLSDDGIDSPTYDGDIESSTTAGHVDHHHSSKISPYLTTNHRQLSSTSTLNIPDSAAHIPPASNSQSEVPSPRTTKSDSHHPVFISPPVNAAAVPLRVPEEPVPVASSQAAFNPASLTAKDIRAFVQKALDGESWRTYKINKPPVDRPVRIYADGSSVHPLKRFIRL